MMKFLKKIINEILKNKGLVISSYKPYFEKLEKVKYNWLKKYDIQTIIDIGANDGGFARKARRLFEKTQIYSFEPIPEIFEKLKLNFSEDKLFEAINVACSDEKGEIDFFLSSNSGSSLLLNMGVLHKNAYPDSAEIKKINLSL